jgi:heme oxygenase
MHSLLSHLRDATAASHETLDGAFGSLDLTERGDYVRFLSGHAIGMAPLFDSFRAFVEDDLQIDCPDFTAMLRTDLAALGVDAGALPSVTPPAALSKSATAYVVAGSRLGLAMIRKAGYWGRSHDLPSAYMEDDAGRAIWKDVVARLKQRIPDQDEAAREGAAAVAAFDTFREAFAASASAGVA